MKTASAKLLVEMMPEQVSEVLRNFGVRDMDDVSGDVIDYLKKFKLIERTPNLITGELVWVVTQDGKKCRKFL